MEGVQVPPSINDRNRLHVDPNNNRSWLQWTISPWEIIIITIINVGQCLVEYLNTKIIYQFEMLIYVLTLVHLDFEGIVLVLFVHGRL